MFIRDRQKKKQRIEKKKWKAFDCEIKKLERRDPEKEKINCVFYSVFVCM